MQPSWVFGVPLNLPAAVVRLNRLPESTVQEMSSFLLCIAPLQLHSPSLPPVALMKAAFVDVQSPQMAPASCLQGALKRGGVQTKAL
jgi:hypothetical protein